MMSPTAMAIAITAHTVRTTARTIARTDITAFVTLVVQPLGPVLGTAIAKHAIGPSTHAPVISVAMTAAATSVAKSGIQSAMLSGESPLALRIYTDFVYAMVDGSYFCHDKVIALPRVSRDWVDAGENLRSNQ